MTKGGLVQPDAAAHRISSRRASAPPPMRMFRFSITRLICSISTATIWRRVPLEERKTQAGIRR